MTGRPAAFLDRDGTIIVDLSYVARPEDVRLLPGAAQAIRALNERGIAVIVVTNQSGIARGVIAPEQYDAVRRRIDELLAAHHAHLDAVYTCPHHPDYTGPCECRKPGLALYRQAIAEHAIDPARSLYTGDRWRDVAPAAALGGRAIMLDVESTPAEDRERARAGDIETAASLRDAVARYLDDASRPGRGEVDSAR